MDENSNQSNLQDQLPTTSQHSIKKSSHFLHDILDIKSEETNDIINSHTNNNDYLSSLVSSLASNSITNNLAFSFALNNTLNNSQMSTNRNRLVECVVCHDKSSGKHYGQYTCEGCKSFFKRSVRRNLTYQCRANKQCPIDQHHRNQCQHCRFKKCLKMGMRREAVQRGRTPIDQPATSSITNKLVKHKDCSLMASNKLAVSRPANDFLNDFASKILFNIFEWSIALPVFNSININDKIELLTNSWCELFVLFAAQSNILVDDLKLDDERENANSTLNNTSNCINSVEQDMDNFKIQLNKIRSLNLDFEEYSYFRALVLFNPDSLKLENKELIENYQNNFQISLSNLSNLKDKTKLRFGKILLLLKSTCHFIHNHSIENLFFRYLLLSTDYSSIEQLIRKLLKWNFDAMNRASCDTKTTTTTITTTSDLPNAALILNAYYTSVIKKNYFDFFSLNNLYPASNKS